MPVRVIVALAALGLAAACELPADTMSFDREEIPRLRATTVKTPANPAPTIRPL